MGSTGWASERAPEQRALLPQVQRVFLGLLAASVCTSVVPWLLSPQVPHRTSWVVMPALAGHLAIAWRRSRRDSAPLALDVVSAAAVLCLVWAVGTGPANGLLYVALIHRSLYGRLPGLLAAVGLQLGALVGGTVLAGQPLADADLPTNVPGLICVAGAFHLLSTGLRRYETGSQARFAALVRASSDAVLLVDSDTTVTWASPALQQVFGRSDSHDHQDTDRAGEAPPPARLIDRVAAEDRDLLQARITALLPQVGASTTVTCRVRDDSGRLRHVEMTVQNALGTRDVDGLIVNAHDVTARVELAEQLRHQALHDPLTGLANRVLFGDRIERALATRAGDLAVLLVDLDGFKSVNDTMGHAAGDELLVEVAERLRASVRPEDTVARLGGDEFAVLLTGPHVTDAFVRSAGQRLLTALAPPAALSVGTVQPAASIGGALGDSAVQGPGAPVGPAVSTQLPAELAEEVLRRADLALYQAKADGKQRLELYRPDLHAETLDRLALEVDLRGALERRELLLHYQPIFNLDNGDLVGVEALLRWEHGTRGMISPADFIPIGEASRLIHPIGAWVLREACRRVASWQRQAPGGPALRLSVNLSAHQFEDPALTALVAGALTDSGLRPGTLTVELTESVLATDPTTVLRRLQEIRALGVRVAIDDFGTGYSALSYLQRYPVDELKIDRSFVERLNGLDPDAATLTSAIIAMGLALRLDTVAEGIETESQHTQLTALGCHLGQGFRLSRPLSERALEALLETTRPVPVPALTTAGRADAAGVP